MNGALRTIRDLRPLLGGDVPPQADAYLPPSPSPAAEGALLARQCGAPGIPLNLSSSRPVHFW